MDKKETIRIIEQCIDRTAIYYGDRRSDFWPAIKLYSGTGRVFFISKDRMLDSCYVQIPEWNRHEDLQILWDEIETNKSLNMKMCESHEDQGEYCYSIFKVKR